MSMTKSKTWYTVLDANLSEIKFIDIRFSRQISFFDAFSKNTRFSSLHSFYSQIIESKERL